MKGAEQAWQTLMPTRSFGSSLFPMGDEQENRLAQRRGDAENTVAMRERYLESGITRCVNGPEEDLPPRRRDDEGL